MPARRSAITVLLLAALGGLTACSTEHLVQITNHLGDTVTLEIDQFRGDPTDPGHPPREFNPALRLRSDRLQLAPGEARAVKFSGAAGGFWLRWRVVEVAAPAFTVLDLLHQTPAIDLH